MKIINICLARIESKKLSRKLLKLFNEKPLIHYTAEIMEQLEGESYIYTDSEELKKYIKTNFKSIIVKHKPEKYCQDKHLTNIELLDYNQELQADAFVYLAGTSPIRKIESIKNIIQLFKENIHRFDCAMSTRILPDKFYMVENYGFNYDKMKRTFVNSEVEKRKIFEETGSLYIFKKELLNSNFFINDKCMFAVENWCRDIDTIEDFKIAEFYYKEIFKNEKNI